MRTKTLLFSVILIALSSCIEIEEKITVNKDRSGKLELTVRPQQKTSWLSNLTSMLDFSLDAQTESQIDYFVNELKGKEGISNVSYEINSRTNNYGITLDFESAKALNKAIYEVAEVNYNFLSPKYITIKRHSFKRRNLSPLFQAFLNETEIDPSSLLASAIIDYVLKIELPEKPKKVSSEHSTQTKIEENTVIRSYQLSKALDKKFDNGIKIKY